MRTSQSTDNNNKKMKRGKILSPYMQTKLAITFGVIMLALIALIVVIYQLVRNNSEEYNKIVLSQRQASYSSRTIPFRRGDIMDRNGTVLATSQKVYNLIIDPRVIHSGEGDRYVEPTVKALNEYFGYDETEIRTLLSEKADKSYVKYAKELSYDQKSGFEEYMKQQNSAYLKSGVKSRIRGIWFEDEYKRTYPYGSMACNVIGFANADGSNGTGGVEQYYNDTLVGVNGREYGYMDSDTKLQSVLKQPTDGETIVTTINTNIQMALEKYLNEWQTQDVGSKVAAAVVMDPNTGEVLAMGSTNQYDLNNPRALDESVYTDSLLMELGRKEAVGVYKREHPDDPPITEDEVGSHYSQDEILSYGKQVAWNQTWRNVVVSDTYEPGSTAKSITLAGALEERAITPNTEFNCEGFIELSDGVHTWRIRCHNHDGDGIIDAQTGLMKSCNVYLMNTAFALGGEKFVKYQHLFGFGEKTGIDLPAEADTSKLVYTPEKLGKTTLATNSFGQNYNVTMIQMAAAYCSIVNGGSYYKPHVVKQILNSNGTVVENVKPEVTKITCSKSTSDFLREALYQTVEGGTGTKAKIQGYRVGGKTGTAEKIPRSAKNYLVSFVGFAPVEDPQLLVYVIVDTPNLEGEAQATASFAINIERKIMNDALQFMNIAPSSETDPANDLNAKFAQNQEGISSDPMGEQTTTASGETEEGGDAESESRDETMAETKPPVTDEYIDPADDEGFELPDEVPSEASDEEEVS